MIYADKDHYKFTFAYWDRWHGLRVICAGIRLVLTGRCHLTVNMHKPRDMAMMRGALEAGRNYDKPE